MKGRIVKALGKYCTVSYGNSRTNCVLRGKLKQDTALRRFSEPVSVGDYVEFQMDDDGTGVIDSVHERRNVFTRKDGTKDKEDLIASNVDRVVVVQSFKNPRLNLRFVDRVLVRARKEGIECVLCVNKRDLAKKHDLDYITDYYQQTGFRFFVISALNGAGLDVFRDSLYNKLSIFVGYSGVGKSTILNQLFSGIDLRTSDVSESTGKGRHTTTNVELLKVDDTTAIIDTPGVREFGLMDIEPNDLSGYFSEFALFSDGCGFKSCTHDHEPDCAIKRGVENGDISEGRYVSYLNILNSLREYQKNKYR